MTFTAFNPRLHTRCITQDVSESRLIHQCHETYHRLWSRIVGLCLVCGSATRDHARPLRCFILPYIHVEKVWYCGRLYN
ncbi:hypothetical protein Mapa_009723 [Marchantia paleacea]|nr:hypothetical protein Mapa_009723 [Marchantia paleacea]